MGVQKTLLVAVLAVLAVPAWGGAAFAREMDIEERPLRQPSIPATADHVTDFNGYWGDSSLSGQARFLFGLPNYKTQQLERSARRLERFYNDIRDQQPGQAIIRTRDMISPFCDSMLDVVPCGAAPVQPPVPVLAPPIMPPSPPVMPPPPPVPALY
jgi:hypothetical protein